MSLNKDEVKHIAALSRIGVTDEDIDKFSTDLGAFLDWVKQLEEVDVSNVEPTAHSTGTENVSREDVVSEFGSREEIRKLFPEEKDGYDKVKSVL